jgi:hypothetical protein
VLWNCPDRAVHYAVAGDQDFFASDRMMNECGYSHAFGSPGEYRWKDSYGSTIGGVVHVKDPGVRDHDQLRGWRDSLKKGVVVMISEDRAEPDEVSIVTGQTVFFAVTKTSGVSITDERLIRQPTTVPGDDGRQESAGEES